MKLKKLLPIASVASVAAVVAPIVTSCGSATFSYKFDANYWAMDFIPDNQIPSSEHKLVWADEATYEYLSAAKKNKKILADDMLFSTIWYYGYDTALFDEGIIDIEIGNIDPSSGKCSYSFVINATPINYESNKEAAVDSHPLQYKVNVKNFEYSLDYRSRELLSYWNFVPTMLMEAGGSARRTRLQYLIQLKARKDWSVEFTQYADLGGYKTNITLHYDSTNSIEELDAAFFSDQSYLSRYMTFYGMYYFNNVGIRGKN